MLVDVINGKYKGQSFHLRGTSLNTCYLEVNGKWLNFDNADLKGVPMSSAEQELLDYLNENYELTRENSHKFDFIDELVAEIGEEQVNEWTNDYNNRNR